MHGMAATVVATAHMHRCTAKKDKGFHKAHEEFWQYLKSIVKEHAPVVLTGDFNMSLWQVVPRLRYFKHPAEILSWFAWVKTPDADLWRIKEEAEEEAKADGSGGQGDGSGVQGDGSGGNPAPADAGRQGKIMFDPCGIFTLRRSESVV